MKNSYEISDIEFLFSVISVTDRLIILTPTANGKRFTGAPLGKLMKKYVPDVVNSGRSFGPQTSEHAIGRFVDLITGRQDFPPLSKASIGYARHKLKAMFAALNVGFIDAQWAEENLVSCNFHRQIVKNILKQKFKSFTAFEQEFKNQKSHQMYV